MNSVTAWLAALLVSFAVGWHLGGWHIKQTPTADQIFGCTPTQQVGDECP